MEIVFVGAGRLATQLAKALHARGEHIVAVYSRTMASASTLCLAVGGFPTDDISSLPTTADAYLIAVKDAVLPQVAAQLIPGREHCPMFHTAGSVSLGVLGGACHYGVIYPMQTFSKERDVDFTHIPIFIEANDERARAGALALADVEVSFAEIDAPHGHDAFLLETQVQGQYVKNFLAASTARDAAEGVDGSRPFEKRPTRLPASVTKLEELQKGGGA